MSNTLLNSEDFGLKIYDRFPASYREADEHYNLALKRYIQSVSDGGFKYTIEELNGLLNLVDFDTVDFKIIPLLYNQYGLEIFNGIPETYLRWFLPFLSLAYLKKGSISVIPFVVTSLSGIKTTTEVTYDTYGNPHLDVTMVMDYQVNGDDFFPDATQFKRILENFLPFYVDFTIIYSYIFHDTVSLKMTENIEGDNVLDTKSQNGSVSGVDLLTNTSVKNTGESPELDISKNDNQDCLILNNINTVTNRSKIISLDIVDKITSNGTVTVAIPTYSGYIFL